jgi:hypothetical protein
MVMGTVVWCPNRLTNKETHCLQKHATDDCSSTIPVTMHVDSKVNLHNIVEKMKVVASSK